MAELLSKIVLGGTTYNLKDATARANLETLIGSHALEALGNAAWLGVDASVTDGATGVATTGTIKAYVDAQVGAIHKFDVKIVDALPENPGEANMYILYLVPDESAASGTYIEYICVRTGSEGAYTYAFEKIGTTQTDLTDYLKKTATVAGVAFGDDSAISVSELSAEGALNLKALAHKDSAEGDISTIDTIEMNESTVAGNAAITHTSTAVASSGTFTATGTIDDIEYTPAGTVTINTLTQTDTAAVLAKGDYTPEGDVSVTLSGNTFNKITSVGTLPVYTEGSYTAPSVTEVQGDFANEGIVVDNYDASSETLTFKAAGTAKALTSTGFNAGAYTAPTYTEGTLPTMAENTVSVASAAFEGTLAEDALVTGVTYKQAAANGGSFAGTAATLETAFHGTADQAINVSGNYDKADATAAFSVGVTPTVKAYNRTDKTVEVE